MGSFQKYRILAAAFALVFTQVKANPIVDEIFGEATGRNQRILSIPPGEDTDYLAKISKEEKVALMVAARNFANIDVRGDAKQRAISIQEWESIKKSAVVLKNLGSGLNDDFLYYQQYLGKIQDISRGYQNISSFASWANKTAQNNSQQRRLPTSTSVLQYFANYFRSPESGSTPEEKVKRVNDTIAYARILTQQSTLMSKALAQNPELWHKIPADYAKIFPVKPEMTEENKTSSFLTYLTLLESTLEKGLPTTSLATASALKAFQSSTTKDPYFSLSEEYKKQLMLLANGLSEMNQMSQTEIKINFEEFLNSKQSSPRGISSLLSAEKDQLQETLFEEFLRLMKERPERKVRIVINDTDATHEQNLTPTINPNVAE